MAHLASSEHSSGPYHAVFGRADIRVGCCKFAGHCTFLEEAHTAGAHECDGGASATLGLVFPLRRRPPIGEGWPYSVQWTISMPLCQQLSFHVVSWLYLKLYRSSMQVKSVCHIMLIFGQAKLSLRRRTEILPGIGLRGARTGD